MRSTRLPACFCRSSPDAASLHHPQRRIRTATNIGGLRRGEKRSIRKRATNSARNDGRQLVEKLATTVYADPVMEKFGEYATEAVFGLLWGREGLDRKTAR